jgi:hypothetical protein
MPGVQGSHCRHEADALAGAANMVELFTSF